MKGILSILALSLASTLAVAASSTPIGYWKTIDDVTGKPKAIIQVTENNDHTLQGNIVKIFPRPGFDQNELCTACKGANHNLRMVGMTVLTHVNADKEITGHWKDGEILDPKNGKTYHCTLQLGDNNEKLNVRGYIGVPLFGRTQIWQRVNGVDA